MVAYQTRTVVHHYAWVQDASSRFISYHFQDPCMHADKGTTILISSKWNKCLFSRGEWNSWPCIWGDTATIASNKELMTRKLVVIPYWCQKTIYGLCALQKKSWCHLHVRSTLYRVSWRTTQSNRTPNDEQATWVMKKDLLDTYCPNLHYCEEVKTEWHKLIMNFDLQTWMKISSSSNVKKVNERLVPLNQKLKFLGHDWMSFV